MKKIAPKQTKIIKIMAVITGIYAALVILPFTGPIAQFPLHVVRCMRLPYIASNYTESYQTPHNRAYSVTPLTSAFFCSEQDAQAAGFQKATLGE